MARSWTHVRPVEPSDWAVVHTLWAEAVAELPPAGDPIGRQVSPERLREVLQRPGIMALVAVHDDQPVGLVVLTTSPLSGLTDDAWMTVEILYVARAHRGRGVSTQLLSKAALVAEAQGATHLASVAPAGERDANRYYARLGFSSAVTRRVMPTAVLRTRLSGDDARTAGVVLARRRSLRARARAGLRGVEGLGAPATGRPAH